MKTQASIASLALAAGLFLAAGSAVNASPCLFAKGQGIFGTNKLVNLDPNKLTLAGIVGAGALAAVGVMAYRSRKIDGGTNTEESAVPEAFSIPVPPAALEPVAVEDEIENSSLL
jgi:hypothetical protein